MSWFEDASRGTPGDATLPERQRSRGVLVAWLVAGGLVVGLLVAGAVSAVAHFIDDQNATGPAAGGSPRPQAALAALTCGDPAPQVGVGPGRTLMAQVEVLDEQAGRTYDAGAELPVIAALVNAGDEVEVRVESDLAVVAVRDGVVAGEPVAVELRDPDRRDDPSLPTVLTVPPGIGTSVELGYPLVGCDGEPLATGEYTLVVGVRVADAGGADAGTGDDAGGELVGESGPFGVG